MLLVITRRVLSRMSMHDRFFQQVAFLKSAPKIVHLPADEGYEVAFLGRSNAGKSSAINALTGKKALARTSRTPGRTAALNIFQFDDERRLVDVPGFGFAKVPPSMRVAWSNLINAYVACLRGVVLVMDIRHPLRPQECQLLDWCLAAQLPIHIILSKADKLSKQAANMVKQQVRKQIDPAITLGCFSAKDRSGVAELQEHLAAWYELS